MTAMDELRRMLDERGVVWEAPTSFDGTARYDTTAGGYWFHEFDGKITIHGLTPAQAIAATLGRGECKWEPADFITEGEWWKTSCGESFTWEPDGTPRYCPNCGRKVTS